MLNKDIDLTKIEKLLKSLPEDIEVNKIDLTNGYKAEFTKTLDELKGEYFEKSLNNLLELVDHYKKQELLRNSEEE